MNIKSTPLGTKILASLSVLNITATFFCVLSVLFFKESVPGSNIFFSSLISPTAQIFTGLLMKTINAFSWLFVLANLAISLGLMVWAMLLKNTKKTYIQKAVLAS